MIIHGVYHSLSLLMEAAKCRPEVASRHTKILASNVIAPQKYFPLDARSCLREDAGGGVLVSTIQPLCLLESVRTAETVPDGDELDAFEKYVREVTDAT